MCIFGFFLFNIDGGHNKMGKKSHTIIPMMLFINTCILFYFLVTALPMRRLNIWKILCMFRYVPWTAVEFIYKSNRINYGLIAYISKHLLVSTELLL